MLVRFFHLSRFYCTLSCASCAFLFSLTIVPVLSAQEQNDNRLRIGMAVPLAIPNVGTSKVTVRGWQLDQVKEIKLSEASATLKILKAEKVGVPNKQEARHVGDTQMELEITLPEGTSYSTLRLTPVLNSGHGQAYELLVGSSFPTIKEQEPNKGFADAQLLELPHMVEGMIENNQDVDVFAFEGIAGRTIHIELIAAARGSALDASLTLFDANGRPLAFSDDAGDARDPRINFVLPASGKFFVAVQDGLELGGSTHPYLLKVESERVD